MKELTYLAFAILLNTSGEVEETKTFVDTSSTREINNVKVSSSKLVQQKSTVKMQIDLAQIASQYEEMRLEKESDVELINRLIKEGVQIRVKVQTKSK